MKVLQLLHSSHIFHCYMVNKIYVFLQVKQTVSLVGLLFFFLKHLFLHLLFFSYISLLRYIRRHIQLGIHKQCLYEAHHLQGHFLIPITFEERGHWLKFLKFKCLTDCICNITPFIIRTFFYVSCTWNISVRAEKTYNIHRHKFYSVEHFKRKTLK